MSTALTRESLIEVPRWVTAFNFPIIGCSDSPPDHHCPPPFVLFVYFPSHPFSRSLLLPSFFLSLPILVQSRPLSPIFFPSYRYSPTDIRLFSNCHLYFLIFQFPVFLVFFSFTLSLTIYLCLHLSRLLHASFLVSPAIFVFILFSPPSTSSHPSCIRFLHSSLSFCPMFHSFYFLSHSCSFLLVFYFLSILILLDSPFFFPLLSSFPPHATSFSTTAEPPSS